MDPGSLLVPPRPLEITRLVPDPNLHRGRRDGLGHHAHRIGRRPDEERLHHPREGGVDLRRKRGKIRVPGESASHFGRGDRLGQDRDFKKATVEPMVLVPVDIAANHQRFVASEPNRPGLVATRGDRITIQVEPHRRAVIGTDEMMPLTDLIGLRRCQIGEFSIDVVDAGARDSEVGFLVAVSEDHAGLGLGVVLDRTDDAAPLSGRIDRHPGFERDRIGYQSTGDPVNPRGDDERRTTTGQGETGRDRRSGYRPGLAHREGSGRRFQFGSGGRPSLGRDLAVRSGGQDGDDKPEKGNDDESDAIGHGNLHLRHYHHREDFTSNRTRFRPFPAGETLRPARAASVHPSGFQSPRRTLVPRSGRLHS